MWSSEATCKDRSDILLPGYSSQEGLNILLEQLGSARLVLEISQGHLKCWVGIKRSEQNPSQSLVIPRICGVVFVLRACHSAWEIIWEAEGWKCSHLKAHPGKFWWLWLLCPNSQLVFCPFFWAGSKSLAHLGWTQKSWVWLNSG